MLYWKHKKLYVNIILSNIHCNCTERLWKPPQIKFWQKKWNKIEPASESRTLPMFLPICFEVEIVCKRPRTQTNQAMAGYMWTNQIYMAYDRLMVPWVDRSYSLARIFCLRTCTSAAAAVAMHSYSPEYDGDGTLDLGYLDIGWQNSILGCPKLTKSLNFGVSL